MPPLSRTAGHSNQSHVNRLNNFGIGGMILTQMAKYADEEMSHKNFLEQLMIAFMKNPRFLPLSRRHDRKSDGLSDILWSIN